jgi:hypothetical protein
VSKTLTLFCGDISFNWDQVFHAAYFIDGGVEVQGKIREYRVSRSRETGTRGYRGNLPNGRDIQAGIQRIISIQSVRNDILEKERDLEAEPPDSLLFLLSNHRSTGATQPVDKYFALAGLINNELPPYKEPVKDVYLWAAISTTKQQQTRVKNGLALDFLDCARTNTKVKDSLVKDLPSWVLDWSYHQRRAIPLLHWQFSENTDKGKIYFNAPNRGLNSTLLYHESTFSITTGQERLSAHGLEFDKINGVGYNDWPWSSVQNSKERQKCRYPTSEDLADVVWKTCVLNRTARGLRPPAQWGDIFHVYNYRQQWYNYNKGFKIFGHTLEEIILEKMRSQNLKTDGVTREEIAEEELARQQFISGYNPEWLNLLQMAFGIAFGRRRLATTKSGYLCMVPFDTQLGDVIAILHDCHAPVILREGDYYKFIGTCYVHGIMQGEAAKMDGLDPKKFDIR